MFRHNSFNSGTSFRRPQTKEEKRQAEIARGKKLKNIQAWRESKHHAITPEVVAELAKEFGVEIASPSKLAENLVNEHQIFANVRTPEELEDNAPQTVVGIGKYKRGRVQGILMLYNEKKRALGFPGGRVRFGQQPISRLMLEMKEEVNLECAVLSKEPVSEFFLGEGQHIFSAYEVRFTGGKPKARPTEDEPILAITYVDEQTLFTACREEKRIDVKGVGRLPILPNHRKAYLDLVRVRNARKETANAI